MFKIILFFVLACFISNTVTAQNSSTEIANQFKTIDWLLGEWNRTNVKPGRSAIETWTKTSDTEFSGLGITMKEKDTVFVEKLKIISKDGTLFYVADVPGNKQPTYFRITKISLTELVCENPEHDFPKMIAYKKEGSKVTATISGNGKSFAYLFERKP